VSSVYFILSIVNPVMVVSFHPLSLQTESKQEEDNFNRIWSSSSWGIWQISKCYVILMLIGNIISPDKMISFIYILFSFILLLFYEHSYSSNNIRNCQSWSIFFFFFILSNLISTSSPYEWIIYISLKQIKTNEIRQNSTVALVCFMHTKDIPDFLLRFQRCTRNPCHLHCYSIDDYDLYWSE